MRKFLILFSLTAFIFLSCSKSGKKNNVPVIGFLDAFQDETIDQAHIGFIKALSKGGFNEKDKTLVVLYKNAQGNEATLNLALSYLLHQNLRLLATNTTLPTIAAIKKTESLPVFMMVAPSPELAGLLDSSGSIPSNLFGVYENLDYIATSALIVHQLIPAVKRMGVIYSQGETQSLLALNKLQDECKKQKIDLIILPVNSSAETQLVVQALTHQKIDAFFALPDNSVFASFESILKTCNAQGIPIFTSEEGLVKRGALAAYGADIYQWGYQAGLQAANYLKTGNLRLLKPALVIARRKVFNQQVALAYHIKAQPGFINVSAIPVNLSDVRLIGKSKNNNSVAGYYIDALLLGLALASLSMGVYLSLKIFNIPDITTDGSYTLGASITGIMLLHGINTWYALLFSFLGGALAGTVTGIITTKLRVNALLAGILVMTALYSINITIMGRSNIPISAVKDFYNQLSFVPANFQALISIVVFIGFLWLVISYLLRTDFGLAMRATGNSESMVRSLGVNTARMKITGLAISNGLVGVSGFLISQYQGFVDINMGIGIVITGLGSVIIGETIMDILHVRQVGLRIAGVILGSIIFQFVLAATLALGVDVNLLKLTTSVLVLLVVSIPGLRVYYK